MVKLTAGIGPNETSLPVDGPPPFEVPFFADIEDEHVRVRGGGPTAWDVFRGVDATGSSAHDSGKELRPLSMSRGILTVTRTLTSAEILGLSTVPIELVPGVTGKIIWAIDCMAVSNPGMTGYTGGGQNLNIGQQFAVVYLQLASAAQLMGSTAAQLVIFPGVFTFGDVANAEGLALSIWLANEDVTDGDGEIDLTVLYRILDVP